MQGRKEKDVQSLGQAYSALGDAVNVPLRYNVLEARVLVEDKAAWAIKLVEELTAQLVEGNSHVKVRYSRIEFDGPDYNRGAFHSRWETYRGTWSGEVSIDLLPKSFIGGKDGEYGWKHEVAKAAERFGSWAAFGGRTDQQGNELVISFKKIFVSPDVTGTKEDKNLPQWKKKDAPSSEEHLYDYTKEREAALRDIFWGMKSAIAWYEDAVRRYEGLQGTISDYFESLHAQPRIELTDAAREMVRAESAPGSKK